MVVVVVVGGGVGVGGGGDGVVAVVIFDLSVVDIMPLEVPVVPVSFFLEIS